MRISCALLIALVLATATPAAAQISVYSGSYGANWGAYGNATPQLAAACNGLFNCSYSVSYLVLGDPFPGYPKNFVAQWYAPVILHFAASPSRRKRDLAPSRI